MNGAPATRARMLAAALAVFAVMLFAYRLAPVNARSMETRTVTVAAGAGAAEIAADLASRSLIRSPALFTLYAFFSGSAHRLKPGIYQLSQAMSARRIVASLVAGPPEVTVRIREGASVADIERVLVDAGVLEEGTLRALDVSTLAGRYPFLAEAATLEGFLFPDTYRFRFGEGAQEVAGRFLDSFSKKALPHLLAGDAALLRADWYQTLITASLLEREVPSARDRRLVAGIFKKRLALGMALQVDATVAYALCGGYDDCPPLTKADFAVSSPVNTYQHPGLPPQPIANPGVGALTAALSPQSSPYLYYLPDPATGKTVFAATFEEHNDNRARYLSR